eukprot:TRINITY_DN2761_c0_g1_i2.p2 TRINITY_DN2761_c0_g1~~TRINITY_DN2761_c0_g1_i2.p2  ORF type:complete len:222 (+),score=-13.15 TRINITY_DN2761_c0_g1_i2:97-762(+)
MCSAYQLEFNFVFFFNDTATTEIYTLHIVGSVRCVQETGINAEYMGGRNGFDGGQDGLSSEPSCRQLDKKVEKTITAENNYALAAQRLLVRLAVLAGQCRASHSEGTLKPSFSRGFMGKQIGDSLRKPVRGRPDGETQITKYARRSSSGLSFGRGFDSPRLHQGAQWFRRGIRWVEQRAELPPARQKGGKNNNCRKQLRTSSLAAARPASCPRGLVQGVTQ